MTVAEYAAHVGVGGSEMCTFRGGGGGCRGAGESLVRSRLKLGGNIEMGYKVVACIEVS
jgi:hypothetical protein